MYVHAHVSGREGILAVTITVGRDLSGRGAGAEFGPPVQPSRGPPQLVGGFSRSRRLAFNSQLRIGTDQGNPTVYIGLQRHSNGGQLQDKEAHASHWLVQLESKNHRH